MKLPSPIYRSSGHESALTNSRLNQTASLAVQPAPPSAERNRFNGSTLQRFNAFTLVEMLTVIAIIGIIAAVSIPVLKNFGQSNVTVSATRQMLDDIGRARQLAMSQRTTVYMVFLSSNFWDTGGSPGSPNSTWWNEVVQKNQQPIVSNLFDKQLTGYTFLADGALGDQPGRHQWHYLAPWQSLPEGSFIAPWKFYTPGSAPDYTFSDPVNASRNFNIYPFSTNTFPFPTEADSNFMILPYIAFNYLGQLSDYSGNMLTASVSKLGVQAKSGQDYDLDFVGGGVDIPLAQGSIISGKDPTTHAPIMGLPGVNEMPPGNSTNIAYNVIHIDPLTGRAKLEFHKMQ